MAKVFSGSKRGSRSILTARLRILVRYPCRSRYSAMVVSPTGYISNTVVEGTKSLTGPYRMVFSRKSYTLGG